VKTHKCAKQKQALVKQWSSRRILSSSVAFDFRVSSTLDLSSHLKPRLTLLIKSQSQNATQNSHARHHRPTLMAREKSSRPRGATCRLLPRGNGSHLSTPLQPVWTLLLPLVRAERPIDPRHRTSESSFSFYQSEHPLMATIQGTHLTYRNIEPTYYNLHRYLHNEPNARRVLANNESSNGNNRPVAGQRRASVGTTGGRLERVGWLVL
jgi:hypothetical protein